eukprot:SAG31_NODE_12987_length_901_cov_1.395262_1_plen_132_part_00
MLSTHLLPVAKCRTAGDTKHFGSVAAACGNEHHLKRMHTCTPQCCGAANPAGGCHLVVGAPGMLAVCGSASAAVQIRILPRYRAAAAGLHARMRMRMRKPRPLPAGYRRLPSAVLNLVPGSWVRPYTAVRR